MYFIAIFINFINNLIKNFFLMKNVKESFSPLDLSSCFPCYLVVFIWFFPWFSIFFFFFKAFPKGKWLNLSCFIALLWSGANISSHSKYSYLSLFADDNADTFAASSLIFYCNFSSLILTSIVVISFYVLSKIFFPKRKGLSDARVPSITKSGFAVHFL